MILGNVNPTAGNITLLYSNNAVTGNLFFTNKLNAVDNIRIALTSNVTYIPTSNSYIMYDQHIVSNYTKVLSDIHIGSGQALFVYSKLGSTNFLFTGK
jgi:hypothetical protein